MPKTLKLRLKEYSIVHGSTYQGSGADGAFLTDHWSVRNKEGIVAVIYDWELMKFLEGLIDAAKS